MITFFICSFLKVFVEQFFKLIELVSLNVQIDIHCFRVRKCREKVN